MHTTDRTPTVLAVAVLSCALAAGAPRLGFAQHGGADSRATGESHTSKAQIEAERRQAAQDEANRRAAQAAQDAELTEDQRVIAAGGIVKVKRSGELWSGEGKDFSQWYFLTSDPTPNDYVLRDVIFHLVGDRQCGAWAECAEASRTANGATWRFRMQGHDENQRLEVRSFLVSFTKPDDAGGSPGGAIDFRVVGRKATSIGFLKTRYVKAP
jgi:hypothetical protein